MYSRNVSRRGARWWIRETTRRDILRRPIIYDSFPSLPDSCLTKCIAKGPDIYFTVRKCQLFNWRRFQDRAKKKKKRFKCLHLTFRNSCWRQYLVFYCVICGPLGNEKVKSLNCFFPFSVKELQASLSLKVKLIWNQMVCFLVFPSCC